MAIAHSAAKRHMLNDLRQLFDRDIDGLRAQVELYPDDEALWRPVPGLPNVGGTLVLHAAGNLRHYIGAQLGNTGYVRDREAEFATRDLPRPDVLRLVSAARSEVQQTLSLLDPATLNTAYPLPVGDKTFITSLWLSHLSTHLAYHLGQLDYHRRVVTGDTRSAGVVSMQNL